MLLLVFAVALSNDIHDMYRQGVSLLSTLRARVKPLSLLYLFSLLLGATATSSADKIRSAIMDSPNQISLMQVVSSFPDEIVKMASTSQAESEDKVVKRAGSQIRQVQVGEFKLIPQA